MQKVITISGYTLNMKASAGINFVETEYPTLQKYLDDKWQIQNFIPIIKPGDTSNSFAITFILVK